MSDILLSVIKDHSYACHSKHALQQSAFSSCRFERSSALGSESRTGDTVYDSITTDTVYASITGDTVYESRTGDTVYVSITGNAVNTADVNNNEDVCYEDICLSKGAIANSILKTSVTKCKQSRGEASQKRVTFKPTNTLYIYNQNIKRSSSPNCKLKSQRGNAAQSTTVMRAGEEDSIHLELWPTLDIQLPKEALAHIEGQSSKVPYILLEDPSCQEPLCKVSKDVMTTPKTVDKALKTITEIPKAVTEISKLFHKIPKQTVKVSKADTKLLKSVAQMPKKVTNVRKATTEMPKTITEALRAVDKVAEVSKTICQPDTSSCYKDSLELVAREAYSYILSCSRDEAEAKIAKTERYMRDLCNSNSAQFPQVSSRYCSQHTCFSKLTCIAVSRWLAPDRLRTNILSQCLI